MFNTISHCFVPRKFDHHPDSHYMKRAHYQDKPIHGIALGADWLLSGALVTIGALSLTAIVWGGMPIAAQWTLVATGSFLTLCTFVKTVKAIENRWSTPLDDPKRGYADVD